MPKQRKSTTKKSSSHGTYHEIRKPNSKLVKNNQKGN